jgi:hypothetical protein
MSKKPAKSERDVELPDWADDVTPSDEVMKKFYAPTGAFKSGPIVGQPAAAPAVAFPPPAAHTSEEEMEGSIVTRQEKQEYSQTTVTSPEQADTITALTSANIAEKDDKSETASPIPPDLEALAPSIEKATPRVLEALDAAKKPINRISVSEMSEESQPLPFEEFARKWKRYLYPGQMAVMRTLFDLTIAVGANECFTRYSELAAATKMTRRNCINVMNSLVVRGFVTRVEVRNDSTSKGIQLRIHIDPLL